MMESFLKALSHHFAFLFVCLAFFRASVGFFRYDTRPHLGSCFYLSTLRVLKYTHLPIVKTFILVTSFVAAFLFIFSFYLSIFISNIVFEAFPFLLVTPH